ncbi:MAG: phosphatase [Legionella sp.]
MRYLLLSLSFICSSLHADTINNYMNIANNIPQMEMKADPQAQAWARSARNVLAITCETIAETMLQSNETAKNNGRPNFCLPMGVQLNTMVLDGIIQQTYKELSSQQSDKDKMTVSQIAWLGVTKKYPCDKNTALGDVFNSEMAHVAALRARTRHVVGH